VALFGNTTKITSLAPLRRQSSKRETPVQCRELLMALI
jgi:hypothetical protein